MILTQRCILKNDRKRKREKETKQGKRAERDVGREEEAQGKSQEPALQKRSQGSRSRSCWEGKGGSPRIPCRPGITLELFTARAPRAGAVPPAAQTSKCRPDINILILPPLPPPSLGEPRGVAICRGETEEEKGASGESRDSSATLPRPITNTSHQRLLPFVISRRPARPRA